MPFESIGSEEHPRLDARREEELLNLITEEAKLWSSPIVTIRAGDAAREILAEAAKISAGLFVLGTTGASKATRLLATGVVHRVIAEAKAPVITLRQKEEVPKQQPTAAARSRSGMPDQPRIRLRSKTRLKIKRLA